MKYYIISGEASGDLHGSNLMKSLFELDPNADIRFWGGDLMKAVGGTLVSHYKDRAFMGFVEVLGNLNKILGFIKFCKKDIQAYNPDVIIFIDNSGFNLRIARWAKKQGFYTNYYISPQVWASRSKRVEAIKKDVDRMFVILPFEKEYYQKITADVQDKIFKEFTGLNVHKTPQKHDSRRFIYTDDSCISFVHALFRQGRLNVSITLRSSNVIKTLWADYEFLKILSIKIADFMRLDESIPVDLTINIRSAHIVP